MSAQTIVCFGPGPKFKGGISNYNTSLAKAFDKMKDTNVHIVSWTQQYPAILPRDFIDKNSRTDLLEGTNIQVKYMTNYNNPFTWYATCRYIKSLAPQKIIFQWSLAVQGLPVGRMVSWLKKHTNAEVIVDCHFVIQKENSSLDKFLTKIGISKASSFIVHALKTYDELKALFPKKKFELTYDGKRSVSKENQPVIKLYHPIYDLFKPQADFDVEAFKKEHNIKEHAFLFFGFIRKYKGLHNVIESFKRLADERDDVSLLICGESFWHTLDNTKLSAKIKNALWAVVKFFLVKKEDDEKNYRPLELIKKYGLEDKVLIVNEFIPNEDVPKYFQVSDAVVLYYLTATPSGVESLSYNFKLPILATKVGHFPETIEDGFNGYLAEDRDIESMKKTYERFIEAPLDPENVARATEKMSWENYAKAILMN